MIERKPIIRVIACLLLALTFLAQLVGCDGINKMTYTDGKYYIRATDAYYKRAPLIYMPVGANYEEIYARYEFADSGEEYYHRIAENVDPKEYLALVFENYVSGLIYSADITLPTLREFDADRVVITTNSDTWMSMGEIPTKEGVLALIAAFENGEKIEYPASQALETYRLVFTSEKYPAFTMNLRYYYYGKGRTYIYNISTRECRVVPDGILDGYIETESDGSVNA